MTFWLPFALLALYTAAAALSWRDVRAAGATPASARPGLVVGLVAGLGHLGYHAVKLVARGGPDLDFFAAMSVVGALVAVGSSLLALIRPVIAVGAVVFPLALLTLLGEALSPEPAGVANNEPWQIQVHAVVALLAYATLSIAAVVAVLLALEDLALKRHRVEWLRFFPPLQLLEGVLFQLLAIGFVLLTLTLVTGVLFVEDLFAQHLVHKTALSIAAWMVFGTLLFGRWRWGWRGQRAAHLTLAGMALLVLGFLGTKFVLEIVLASG